MNDRMILVVDDEYELLEMVKSIDSLLWRSCIKNV